MGSTSFAVLCLLPTAHDGVRRLIVLTQARSGSSWTGGLLSDLAEGGHTPNTTIRKTLPLFEMFNQRFPFAMLNIYDGTLHASVKSHFALKLVAPLLPSNSTMRKHLEAKGGALVALSKMGKSEYRKYTLGNAIRNDRTAALAAAAKLAIKWHAAWLWFKISIVDPWARAEGDNGVPVGSVRE